MRKEPVVPIDDLIAEAVAFFAVKGKIKIVDKETKDSGELCRKEVRFSKGKLKVAAPFVVENNQIFQNNRPHSLRRLFRDRFGRALHHLHAHGARFTAPADPEPADAA